MNTGVCRSTDGKGVGLTMRSIWRATVAISLLIGVAAALLLFSSSAAAAGLVNPPSGPTVSLPPAQASVSPSHSSASVQAPLAPTAAVSVQTPSSPAQTAAVSVQAPGVHASASTSSAPAVSVHASAAPPAAPAPAGASVTVTSPAAPLASSPAGGSVTVTAPTAPAASAQVSASVHTPAASSRASVSVQTPNRSGGPSVSLQVQTGSVAGGDVSVSASPALAVSVQTSGAPAPSVAAPPIHISQAPVAVPTAQTPVDHSASPASYVPAPLGPSLTSGAKHAPSQRARTSAIAPTRRAAASFGARSSGFGASTAPAYAKQNGSTSPATAPAEPARSRDAGPGQSAARTTPVLGRRESLLRAVPHLQSVLRSLFRRSGAVVPDQETAPALVTSGSGNQIAPRLSPSLHSVPRNSRHAAGVTGRARIAIARSHTSRLPSLPPISVASPLLSAFPAVAAAASAVDPARLVIVFPRAAASPSPLPLQPPSTPAPAGGESLAGAMTSAGPGAPSALLLLLAALVLIAWRGIQERASALPSSIVLSSPVPPG